MEQLSFDDFTLLRGSQVISKKIIRLKVIKNECTSDNIVGVYSPKTKYHPKISIDKGKLLYFLNIQRTPLDDAYFQNENVLIIVTDRIKYHTILFKSIDSIMKCFRFENKMSNNPKELFYENSTIPGLV